MERNLEEEIELVREEMINAANEKGLNADETIAFSRKLDCLLNRFGNRTEGHT